MITKSDKSVLAANAAKLLCLAVWTSICLIPQSASAQRIGYSRMMSSPGQLLRIDVPISSINPADIASLSVKLANQAQWEQAGLKPPVALTSMQVSVTAGSSPDARIAVITSSQAASGSVIDLLLEITTASSSQLVQVGFLVPGAASANLQIKSTVGSSGLVNRGDTLFAIAQRNAVAGASIYQVLVALYQANPDAFINQNMNLLKAGVTLQIPDAETIKAIDSATARNIYAEHLKAMGATSGSSNSSSVKTVVPANTASGAVKSEQAAPPVPPQTSDKVTLATQTQADKEVDARASAAKQLQEEEARLEALQNNIKQLKEAAGVSSQTQALTPEPRANVAVAPPAVRASDAPISVDKPASAAKSFSLQSAIAWGLNNLALCLIAIVFFIAVIIAWLMRGAGKRNDQDSDGDDVNAEIDQAVKSYFESVKSEGHVEPKHVYDEDADIASIPLVNAHLEKINLDLNSPEDSNANVDVNAPHTHPNVISGSPPQNGR